MLLKDIIDNWKKPLNFKPERIIDQPTLEKIIEAARWAPSAENQQVWKFLIITDADKNKIIEKSVRDQDPRLSSNSHSIEKPILKSKFTFSIENYNAKTDKYRNEIAKFHNEELDCINTSSFIIICTHSKKYLGITFGLTDIGASIENMLLICEEFGLKLRWIRNFNRELIRERFDIPKFYSIDALLAIGDSKETHSTPEYQLKNTQDFFGYNDFNEDFSDLNTFSDNINIPTYMVRAKDAILDRRSIRDFKENKKISKEIIYSLLKASMMVPLTINEPYLRFIIIDDQEKLNSLDWSI
ncbi:MAG: nitroreductase family protein [Candidatus Lokiarchaeota archaeon]